jgi:hypothetical protein
VHILYITATPCEDEEEEEEEKEEEEKANIPQYSMHTQDPTSWLLWQGRGSSLQTLVCIVRTFTVDTAKNRLMH